MYVELIAAGSEDYFAWLGSNKLTNLIYVANGIVLFWTLMVIFLSAGIAWITWRATSRHNADEHMHHLFMELLKLRLAYRPAEEKSAAALPEAQKANPVDDDSHVYDLAGMKLYVLEEMFGWLAAQRRIQATIGRFNIFENKALIRDNLKAWDRTIITHALDDFKGTKASIEQFASCYSVAFIDYIARGTRCPELLAIAADHLEKVEAGQKRPLGSREKELADKVFRQHAGSENRD